MESIKSKNHGLQLLRSLSDMRGDPGDGNDQFKDVIVVAKDGCLNIHRIILCSKSKFLEGLLLRAYIEEPDGCPSLFLPDVTMGTLQNTFSLLYSGSCVLQSQDQVEDINSLFSELKITLNVSMVQGKGDKVYQIEEIEREHSEGNEDAICKDSKLDIKQLIHPDIVIKDENDEDDEEIENDGFDNYDELMETKTENQTPSPVPELISNGKTKKGKTKGTKKKKKKIASDDDDYDRDWSTQSSEPFVKRDKPLPGSSEGLPMAQVLEKHNLVFDQLVDTKNDLYTCKTNGCEHQSKKRHDIILHVLRHLDIKPYFCPTCDKSFSTSGNLRGHLRCHLKEEDRPYGCPHCNKRFTTRQKITLHIRIHSGSKPCICPQCGKACTTNSELVSHQRSHGIGNDYVCSEPGCEMKFRYATSLQRHNAMAHGADKEKFKCDICGEFFPYHDKLRYHMKMKHMSKEERDIAFAHLKTHICQECGKAWKNKNELENHMRTHTNERPFSCDQCGKNFKQASALLMHSKFHSGKKDYTCDQCGRAFAMKGTLDAHYRLHTGEKPYSCSYCGKSFAQMSALQGHESRHRGEQPKSYKKKIRPVERNYPCSNCGKMFFDKRDVERHMVIHTGEKEFCCRFCPSKFNRKDNLIGHERRSHLKDEEGGEKKGRFKVPRDAVEFKNEHDNNSTQDEETFAESTHDHGEERQPNHQAYANPELFFSYPAWLRGRQPT